MQADLLPDAGDGHEFVDVLGDPAIGTGHRGLRGVLQQPVKATGNGDRHPLIALAGEVHKVAQLADDLNLLRIGKDFLTDGEQIGPSKPGISAEKAVIELSACRLLE